MENENKGSDSGKKGLLSHAAGLGAKVGGDLKEVFGNKENLEEAKKLFEGGKTFVGGLVSKVTKKDEGPSTAPEGTSDSSAPDSSPKTEEGGENGLGSRVKGALSGLSIFKGKGNRNAGWILWEILVGLAILGYMGYQVMGTSSSTSALNNAATAAQEAEALQAEVHSMYPTGYYVSSGDISSNIVTQKSTPANMLTGGCTTGLCGPFSGSYFTVVPAGTNFTITLQPVTIEQCSQIIEQQAGSGIWQSINGLNVSTALSPTTIQSACGGGSVSWVSQ